MIREFSKPAEAFRSLTFHSWSETYSGNGSEAVVRRFVVPPIIPICQASAYCFSVEELAKKKGMKMAQVALAWSLKRVTAPIVGTTKIQNLKEMIGE